jgi:malate dehydrogenase (oxaloacetate-decarboxylating)
VPRQPANPEIVETSLTGLGLLNTPIFNKGTAFPESERDDFSLHGLLPPQVGTLDQQVARRMKAFRAIAPPEDQSHDAQFSRYTFMRDLQDVNETLYYAIITRNIAEMLPVVYTPAVGEGCQRFSDIWRRPRGVFLSYPNIERIGQILGHPRYDGVRCIVVSDGERILGLGDQGAGGMGIPIGKLALYTALAGIHPLSCLPVFLDVGTDNMDRVNDPLYLGWKNERIRGEAYDKFVDRFVGVVKKRWPHVLLQWEDFAGGNAARLLTRYRDELPSFNDDIQGTASVAVATVLAAVNVTGVPLTQQKFVLFGFGAAGQGIAGLIKQALVKGGLSEDEARRCFWAVDKDGLLVDGMVGLRDDQTTYARPQSDVADWHRDEHGKISLLQVVERVQPTVLIGVSGQPGAFTEDVVRAMARGQQRPAILPLSNPTSRVEAKPEDVIAWSDGRAIVGTGSPFAPVSYDGREIRIAQTNNAYIFPGLALAVVCARAKHVSDGMMMAAAEALARLSPTRVDTAGGLLPPLEDLRKVSVSVAVAVGRQAALEGLAVVKGEAFIEALRKTIWEPVYRPYKRRRN